MSHSVSRHPEESTLLDLAAGRAGSDPAASVRDHLDSGCRLCAKRIEDLARVVRAVKEEAAFERVLAAPTPFARPRPSADETLRQSRDAFRISEEILGAARTGSCEAAAALRALHGKPGRGFALLYVCQTAPPLVFESPARALELAELVANEAASLESNDAARPITPVSRQGVEGEAELLASQALLALGRAPEARQAALRARPLFEATGEPGLGAALCDYFEGSAASFEKDYPGGERLLKRALKVFSEFAQDHLAGRAEAALGVLYSQRGDHRRALVYFAASMDHVDPERDANSHASIMVNQAATLAHLGRLDEAKRAYARALAKVRRYGFASLLHCVRNGLADLDVRRGEYGRALRAFSDLARDAAERGFVSHLLFARLYVAECLGRLGRTLEMMEAVAALRQDVRRNRFESSPALGDLFSCMEKGELDAGDVEHVRRYLQDLAEGRDRPYRQVRMAG